MSILLDNRHFCLTLLSDADFFHSVALMSSDDTEDYIRLYNIIKLKEFFSPFSLHLPMAFFKNKKSHLILSV